MYTTKIQQNKLNIKGGDICHEIAQRILKKKHLYSDLSYAFNMIVNKTILIGLGVVIGLYLLYKLFFSTNKFDEEYNQLYNKVLTSEEYKVKGQYDK